jgi:predicted ATPase with chaperone activity
LRVGRTLADLEGDEFVQKHHIAEALGYRHRQPRAPAMVR